MIKNTSSTRYFTQATASKYRALPFGAEFHLPACDKVWVAWGSKTVYAGTKPSYEAPQVKDPVTGEIQAWDDLYVDTFYVVWHKLVPMKSRKPKMAKAVNFGMVDAE